jgi:hypothetical protein
MNRIDEIKERYGPKGIFPSIYSIDEVKVIRELLAEIERRDRVIREMKKECSCCKWNDDGKCLDPPWHCNIKQAICAAEELEKENQDG